MNNSLMELKASIRDNGLEIFDRFYGTYIAVVEAYYSETNTVDVYLVDMFNDSNFMKSVPITGYPNLNLPLEKGDYVMITFLWGHLNYPLASYSYHSNSKKETTKDEELISQDYIKFKSKKKLFFEELETGFRISKGKVKFEMTEKSVILEINGASIVLDSDFKVKTNGNIELKNNKRNKMVSFNGLMTVLRDIQAKHDSHIHPGTFAVTGSNATGVTLTPSPQGMIYNIPDSVLAITDVFGG